MTRHTDKFLQGSSTPKSYLKMLWVNWLAGCGALTLIMILSIFINYELLPLFSIGTAFILHHWRAHECLATAEGKLTFPPVKLCIMTLWISAAIMLAILILCTPFLVGRVVFIPLYNDEIPFITSLIIFPVLALCSALWFIFNRKRLDSTVLNAESAKTGVLMRETSYQVQMMFILSLVLGSIEAWYYFTTYINSNFNAPDHFFFVIMPLGIYLLSLFFMGGRYTSLSALVNSVNHIHTTPQATLIRFLIFSENEILVCRNPLGFYDTPVESIREMKTDPTEEEIRTVFTRLAEIQDFKIRYLYRNEAFSSNLFIMHYAAILGESGGEREKLQEKEGFRWVSLFEIQKLAAAGELSPVLASELVRIYSVTMAWKTYNQEGRRLYPIRNYKPTFRFRDLGTWNVDYDDPIWLEISSFNEDTPFYRIRKLFRRQSGTYRRNV